MDEQKQTEQEQISNPVLLATSVVCQDLTNAELCAINLAAQLDYDPRPVMGYEKAKPLFTEHNGLRMHEETKLALSIIAMNRLEQETKHG